MKVKLPFKMFAIETNLNFNETIDPDIMKDHWFEFLYSNHYLYSNGIKIATENVSIWNHFQFGGNKRSKCHNRSLFKVSLQNF